jgi:hypothetical protein
MPLTVEALRARSDEVLGYGWAGKPADAPPFAPEEVLPHLESEDRNVRVAALRVLAWCDGQDAISGILRGLDDPVKRVRIVAAKSSVRFVTDPTVVARLRRAVEEDERASGRAAMEVLGGMFSSPLGLYQLEPVAGAMRALAEQPQHRQKVLTALLRSHQLNAEMTEVLREFVRTGTKDEAVFATRRLDGFRVAHDGELRDTQRAEAERAYGRVWWWVRVS